MRTRKRGALVVAVVVTLAILVFTALVNPGFARSKSTKNIGGGKDVTVSATGNHLPHGLNAHPANAAMPLKGYTALTAKPLEITPAGKLKTPVTLHFKLARPVDKKMQPYVIVVTSEKGATWKPITPTFSKDGRTLSVQTDHFSLWWPLQMVLDWTQNFGHEIVDALTGDLTE